MATLVTFDEYTSGEPPRGGTIREVVMAQVTNVVNKRRPLLANLGETTVTTTFVESLEDILPDRGHNAAIEGQAFTDITASQPARLFTHIQSFYESGRVSDEQRLVGHYNADPLIYQKNKKLQKLLNDVEHTFHRGSAASGTSSASRQTTGLINLATTTTFTSSSGTTFTESVLVDLLQVFSTNDWDVQPSQAYVHNWLKRTISEFSTKVTRNVDANDRSQILIVERHTSDFGDLDVFMSNDQLRGSSATTQGNSITFIDPRHFMKAWLRFPMIEDLSRDGLRDRFQINAQCGLLYKTDKAVGGGTGFVPYITVT
jgi:hypothetical protein